MSNSQALQRLRKQSTQRPLWTCWICNRIHLLTPLHSNKTIPSHNRRPSVTKIFVLPTSLRIYGPIGFLNPITIQAIILMQELWQSGVNWDELLNQEYKNTRLQSAKDLQESITIQIPRHYFTPVNGQPMELHVFSDASMKVYGAVPFLIHNGKKAVSY